MRTGRALVALAARFSTLALPFAASLALVSVALVSVAPSANAATCDLSQSFDPDCFQARATPVVKVFLMQYGTRGSTLAELQRAGALLQRRFDETMQGALTLDYTGFAVVPLKEEDRDLAAILPAVNGDASKKSPERLTRLWYYYNLEPLDLVAEIHAETLLHGYGPELRAADAMLVLSEAQFEALGFAAGGFAITEQPSEIAWSSSDGGLTDYQDPPRLADELLHELGHVLGLDHAAKHCYDGSTPPSQVRACCENSASGNDVMSYCRERAKVDDTFYFGYTACTRDYLARVTRPAMLAGGNRVFQPAACE